MTDKQRAEWVLHGIPRRASESHILMILREQENLGHTYKSIWGTNGYSKYLIGIEFRTRQGNWIPVKY